MSCDAIGLAGCRGSCINSFGCGSALAHRTRDVLAGGAKTSEAAWAVWSGGGEPVTQFTLVAELLTIK